MRPTSFAFGILLTCAFASIAVGTHVDDITQILTGIASNVQGPIDVASIVSCGSESIFTAFETGLLPILNEVASCNPLDATDIEKKVTALTKAIPDAAQQCFNESAEAKKLLAGLGLSGLTADQVKSKVTSYVFDNLLSICGTFGDLDSKFKSGDFSDFGTEAGKIVLAIFKSSSKLSAENTSVDMIVDILTGIASSVNTTVDGDSISKCFKQPFADAVIYVLTNFTTTIARMEISRLSGGIDGPYFNDLAHRLGDSVTEEESDCIFESPEIKKIAKAYGLEKFGPYDLYGHLIDYVNKNGSKLFTLAARFKADINENDWLHFGVLTGETLHDILYATD